MKIIPSVSVFEQLGQRRRHADLHVGISHRSYLRNDGGIEHCLRRESEMAGLAKVDYLHLCPPETKVCDSKSPVLVEVCLNDHFIGLTSLDGFSAKLGLLQPSMTFLHSALGFESNSLIRLLLNLRPFGPVFQWIHDLAYACGSVILVRDGIACGVPELDARECNGCSFNSGRAALMVHYDQIERLSDCQVFPSLTAQSRYNRSRESRGQVSLLRPFVLPHYVVNGSHSEVPQRAREPGDEPIGIAFFGHGVPHKGWLEYLQLVSALYDNPAYRFYHIGTISQVDPRIERLDFSEASAANAGTSLPDVCASRNIKLAFFWPVAMESFGIMLRQVLAAGCAVLCADNNEALKEFIYDCPQLRYFSRLDQMITWLGDGQEVAALLRQARQSQCVLIPSACSYTLINKQTGKWQITTDKISQAR